MRDYPKKFSAGLAKRKNTPLFEEGGEVDYYKGKSGRAPPPDEPEYTGSRAMPEQPEPPEDPEAPMSEEDFTPEHRDL